MRNSVVLVHVELGPLREVQAVLDGERVEAERLGDRSQRGLVGLEDVDPDDLRLARVGESLTPPSCNAPSSSQRTTIPGMASPSRDACGRTPDQAG